MTTDPAPPPPAPAPIRVVDDPAGRRYHAFQGDVLAGIAEYRLAGDRVVFTHTEVPGAFAGRGVATTLVKAALDDVRRRGLRVTPLCPLFQAYIERHPAYRDLVALPGRPGRDVTRDAGDGEPGDPGRRGDAAG